MKENNIENNENSFETEEEARNFFEKLGFSIESHSFMEVFDNLSSPKKLGLSESQVKYVRRCSSVCNESYLTLIPQQTGSNNVPDGQQS